MASPAEAEEPLQYSVVIREGTRHQLQALWPKLESAIREHRAEELHKLLEELEKLDATGDEVFACKMGAIFRMDELRKLEGGNCKAGQEDTQLLQGEIQQQAADKILGTPDKDSHAQRPYHRRRRSTGRFSCHAGI